MDSNETNTLSQRRLTGGPIFRFHERHLEYFGLETDFKVKYEDIFGPSRYRRDQTKDWAPRFAIMYLVIIALILLQRQGHDPYLGMEGLRRLIGPAFGFVVVLSATYWSIYYATHKEFTVIPSGSGNLLVVKDQLHDAIIQKIATQRLASLRLLSAPNPANSPEEEVAKLRWLHQEGAIADEEFSDLAARSTI